MASSWDKIPLTVSRSPSRSVDTKSLESLMSVRSSSREKRSWLWSLSISRARSSIYGVEEVDVPTPTQRETTIRLTSLSISKILPLNLRRELSTPSNLILNSDKSSIKEEICGTIEESKEGSVKALDGAG